MTLGNDKKELRKGERFMVTIEEVLHDTLLVFLEYRRTKFCGVLLNTSGRRGPYGLQGQPQNAYYRAYDIDPAKLEAKERNEPKKVPAKVTFPDMLSLRTTYGQKVPQPPPRQIYMKRRRSKRKVRMDMIGTDDALRIAMGYSGRKLLSHHSTCCCDKCAARGLQELSKVDDKPPKGKRKLLSDGKNEKQKEAKRQKWVDGVAPLSGEPKRLKVDKKTEQKKPEAEEANDESGDQPLKRSPVIKISYKSPGGKGRVLKIPSRLHATPGKSGKSNNKSVMHEIARKVVNRAKNEHYKYMHEQKAGKEGTTTTNRKHSLATNKILAEKKYNLDVPTESPENISSKNAKTSPKAVKSSSPNKITASPSAKDIAALDATKKSLFSKRHSEKDCNSEGRAGEDSDAEGRAGKGSGAEGSAKKGSPAEARAEKDRSSPHVSPRKRETRNFHPHVLLQPLTGDTKEEPASAPSQNLVKSKPVTVQNSGTVGDDANDHPSSSSQSVGTASSDENKTHHKISKKHKISHSISVTRCTTENGVKWCQGDVVWGKIMGFPWWPGLIRRIVVKKEDGKIEQVAVVDWFQSKTISHIPCQVLEGFSDCFAKRFDRKRKGKYRHAIRDAREAEKNMSPEVRKLIVQFET